MNREKNRNMDEGCMPHRGGKGDHLLEELAEKGMLLFVGSVNCLRHKPYRRIGALMREGRAALLCPSMSDFSSGRYLNQIVEALAELSREHGEKRFVIACGCQWVILSTDSELLKERVKREYDIDLTVFEDAHLEFGDHE
ncbi:MAG: hypothetical protein LUI14_02960 [Lachnospiraceae bacterium]|nr:hypothetical protein [Lachnospiraceae bacterium]